MNALAQPLTRDAPGTSSSGPPVSALMRRADEMIVAGRPGAARPLLAALGRLAAPLAPVADLGARLAIHEDRLADALAGLDAAIATAPDGLATLHRRRAEVHGRLERYGDAARDAAEAVLLDPADPVARALLGATLLMLGHLDEAIACLTDALAREPASAPFRMTLAEACERSGDAAAAARTLTDGIALAPRVLALRTRLALLQIRAGDPEAAIAVLEVSRKAGLVDALLFGLMGHALSSLGRSDAAAGAYAQALRLGPDDAYVRHLVAAAGLLPAADRAPAAYVQTVFDGYAARFDTHLLSLGYRVPGLIRAELRARLELGEIAGRVGPVLDLGCGTGLVAVALQDLKLGPFRGVDLSPRMIASAGARGLYVSLHVADMLDWLARDATEYPVILAADALCYFGDLGPVLALARARLALGGLFVFSLESSDAADTPWVLDRTGRYRHAPEAVRAQAASAGLTVRGMAPEAQRYEQGRPAPGLIVTLVRADAG